MRHVHDMKNYQAEVRRVVVIREFKFDFDTNVDTNRSFCARKKAEEKCIGSRHYRSQGYFW